MLPSLSLPPVVCCFGTNPIQAARLRPDENAFQQTLRDCNLGPAIWKATPLALYRSDSADFGE
jgi:hypothetical protein